MSTEISTDISVERCTKYTWSANFNIHRAIGRDPLDCVPLSQAVEPNLMDLVWFCLISLVEFDWLRNQTCTKFGVQFGLSSTKLNPLSLTGFSWVRFQNIQLNMKLWTFIKFWLHDGPEVRLTLCLKHHYDQMFTSWWKNENAVYHLQIPALVPEIFKFEKCLKYTK